MPCSAVIEASLKPMPPIEIVAASLTADVATGAPRTAAINRSATIRMMPGPQSLSTIPNLFDAVRPI